MKGAQFIRHDGIEILQIDFSYVTSLDEILRIMEEAKALLVTRPSRSVLTLTDTTETHFDGTISQAFKEYAAHNEPYVKAAALVGITPIRKIIYNAVSFFSKRHLELCNDMESAKAWLISQH